VLRPRPLLDQLRGLDPVGSGHPHIEQDDGELMLENRA
jgi:hypothetical protein